MNILITGAFGFVGSNISTGIKNSSKHHLTAIDLSQPADHSYDEFYSWSELDKVNWDRIDVIIHLAGKAHDTRNSTDEQTYFNINVGLTQKIFEYFLISRAGKFIFFSSVKAVADQVPGEFLTEETKPEPLTSYGKSKLEAEKYLYSMLLPDNKKVYILRPSMIHGPGNKGNLNLLYKLMEKGLPWPLGAFENKRSFTSISNVLFAINHFVNYDIVPGTYQMADDEPVSTNRLIRLISESKGKKTLIWNISPGIIKLFARAGDFLHLPLNSERLKKLTENYIVSNKHLKNALGIDNFPMSAEEGLKLTLSSF